MVTLSERLKKYEDAYNYIILSKLPIIVRAEIRNFSRLTKKIKDPYSIELSRIIRETMFSSVKDIEGAIFSYNHGSEINFILRIVDVKSSQDFYGNKIQKIGSVVGSICSNNFMKNFLASDDPPDLIGEAIFEVVTFPLPSISEVMNYLLLRQRLAEQSSTLLAVEHEMLKLYDKKTVHRSLNKKGISEKKDLLLTECNVKYEDYPAYFRLGSCCYKAPKLIKTYNSEMIKKKWIMDVDCFDFVNNKDVIMNIIRTGQDVVKLDRDIETLDNTEN